MNSKRFWILNVLTKYSGIKDRDKLLTFDEVVDTLNNFQELSINDLKKIESLEKEIFELKYDMDRLRINNKKLKIENNELKDHIVDLNGKLMIYLNRELKHG